MYLSLLGSASGKWPAPRFAPSVVVGLLVAIGLALRLPGINYSMSPDDIGAFYQHAIHGFSGVFLEKYACMNHPLCSFFVWICYRFIGEMDWSLHLPSLLFGLATIPLIYRLALRLYNNTTVGVIAALAVTVAPVHIAYSATCRGYTMMIFFATLATLFLVDFLERPRSGSLLGICVSTFLMGMSQVASLMLYAGFAVVILGWGLHQIATRQPRRNFKALAFAASALGAGLVLVGIGYLPAVNLFSGLTSRVFLGHWTNGALQFLSAAEQEQFYPLRQYTLMLTGAEGAWCLPMAAFVVIGIWKSLKEPPRGLFAPALFIFPLGATLVINMKLEPRYLLGLFPFYVLLASAGIGASAGVLQRLVSLRPHRFLSPNLGALLLVAGITLAPTYYEYFPWHAARLACVLHDYQSVIRAVLPRIQPQDFVVYRRNIAWPLNHYYTLHIQPKLAAAPAVAPDAKIWFVGDQTVETIPFAAEGVIASEADQARVFVSEFGQPRAIPILPRTYVEGRAWSQGADSWQFFHPGPGEAIFRPDAANPIDSEIEVGKVEGDSDCIFRSPPVLIPRQALLVYRALVRETPDAPHAYLAMYYNFESVYTMQFVEQDVPRGGPIVLDGQTWRLLELPICLPPEITAVKLGLRLHFNGSPGSKAVIRNMALWTNSPDFRVSF